MKKAKLRSREMTRRQRKGGISDGERQTQRIWRTCQRRKTAEVLLLISSRIFRHSMKSMR